MQKNGSKRSDVLVASGESEEFSGFGGYDRVSYLNSLTGVGIDLGNLANNSGDATGDSYSSIELFVLSLNGDLFVGADGKDSVNGRTGNDSLSGGGNDDLLLGEYGNDTLVGGDGKDGMWGGGLHDLMLGGAGNDKLYGDAGNDTLDGGAGNDIINGGTGIDWVLLDDATAGVRVNLATVRAQNTGGAGIDTIGAVENLVGSSFDDRLTGNAGGNVIAGGRGQDVISAGNGNDTLDGGEDHDALWGGNQNDQLSGGAGDDQLYGENGNDVVAGGEGADTIAGGSGNDMLGGGAGDDTFLFDQAAGIDTILDFVAGAASDDVIDISAFNFAGLGAILAVTTNSDVDLDGSADDCAITLSAGVQVRLINVVAASLGEDDFAFA